MPSYRVRSKLVSLHRWAALALSPVFLVILVTGAILAFRPILGRFGSDVDAARAGGVDVPALVALLARVDSGGRVPFAGIEDDRRTVTLLSGRRGAAPLSYQIATGQVVPTPPETPPDFFDRVQRVHTDLWWGMGVLVALATVAMFVLIITGPLMSRPQRAGTTARGWHVATGWVLWPVVALLPVTVLLMKLHAPIVTSRSAPPLPLGRALAELARTTDASRLIGIQQLPGGALALVAGPGGAVKWSVRAGQVRPMDTAVSRLGHALHAGTWAGPLSGVVNLAAVLVVLVMMATGIASWLRRRQAVPSPVRESSERPVPVS